MPRVNYYVFLLILFFTMGGWAICWVMADRPTTRFFSTVFLSGLWFYGGAGAAMTPISYGWYYCIFVLSIVIGFVAAVRGGHQIGGDGRVYRRLEDLGRSPAFRWIICAAYLGTFIVPLLYPNIQLVRIWSPPAPDLIAIVNGGVSLEQPLLLRLNGYLGSLLAPFFLLALYWYRRRYVVVAIALFLPLYCQYCATAYMARSGMVMALALFIAILWLDRPSLRLRVVAVVAILLPVLLVGFGMYSRLRLGVGAEGGITALEQIQNVLEIESAFPRSWEPLEGSRLHADLGGYFKWLFTLPIPKVITGEIRGARINEEISGIVTGVYPGDKEYSMTLTGPVLESVYIYGKLWFWIHGLFIGTIAGALCVFTGQCRCLLVMFAEVALQFGYVFNRAGVTAVLPPLVNYYVVFYAVVFVFWSMAVVTGPSGASRRDSGAVAPC